MNTTARPAQCRACQRSRDDPPTAMASSASLDGYPGGGRRGVRRRDATARGARGPRQPADIAALVLGVLALCSTGGAAIAAGGDAAASGDDGRPQALLVEVELNDRTLDGTVLALRDGSRRVLLSREDLADLGLLRPDTQPVVHDSRAYHALNALANLTYELDERTLLLSIDAPASVMQSHRISVQPEGFEAPDEPASGVFVNHDLLARVEDTGSRGDGLLDVGLFGDLGSLESSQVFRGLGEDPEAVRLETMWRRDFPQDMRSLRVGDTVGFAGSWGRPVRFGGVQWGTDFTTRPGFVTFPLPRLEGETALPSTLDVYIDNSLRFTRDIPAGPFVIDDVPVVSGGGDIALVVRDMLGRERTIVQPYYTSSTLLRDGLHEYSYELGAERDAFGEESDEYGRVFGSLTHRLGLNGNTTGELRAEAVEDDQQTAGLSLSVLWPATGVWSLSLAGSQRGDESGGLLGLGFERQQRRFKLGGRVRLTDREFTQLGLKPGASAAARTTQLFASARLNRRGSVALSYVERFKRNDDDVRFAQASVSWGLGGIGSLRVAALYPWRDGEDPTFTLSFARSLGGGRNLHAESTTGGERTIGKFRLHQSPPLGPGSGYALEGTIGDKERLQGTYVRNARHGAYSLEAESAEGDEALRAGMKGSLVWIDGRPMAARDLGDAFAIVEIPGLAGIDVYKDNQLVGRTDSDGRAVVHGLLPYDRNSVRIDATQLPLDVQAGVTEWNVVPRRGGAVRVYSDAHHANGAVFRLLSEDGAPVPAGTVIHRVGTGDTFPVGHDGFSYVTGLEESASFYAQWDENTCVFELNDPASGETLPDLGETVCRPTVIQ